MAHEVENMFSVKETPWHGLGHIVTEAPTVEQVLTMAGLDWSVSMRPLYLGDGTEVGQKAIMRDSDNSVLGYAGKRYKPLQNSEALDFFRVFHDSGECSFETAGSLRSGQKVWIMAALNSPEMEIVKGDTVRKYLMLSNGHDGITGIRVGFTPVRVVCANTLAMAHNNNDSKLIRIFHSKKVVENLELLKNTINAANASFEATAEQYRHLAKRQVNKGDLEKYVTKVFYNGKAAESDREKIARESLNKEIQKLFEAGHGNQLTGVEGTYWALYNGVTQYLSYESGRTQDSRMDSLWFGDNRTTNSDALKEALVMAA
jgi:phage/plasmid-like protein (TIGR03299 family)